MVNIFVVSFAYNNNSVSAGVGRPLGNISTILQSSKANASLEVRVSYFSTCIRQPQARWNCASDSILLANLGLDQDPLNLIRIAHEFQHGVLFSGIL